jgi:hypothetical protein
MIAVRGVLNSYYARLPGGNYNVRTIALFGTIAVHQFRADLSPDSLGRVLNTAAAAV